MDSPEVDARKHRAHGAACKPWLKETGKGVLDAWERWHATSSGSCVADLPGHRLVSAVSAIVQALSDGQLTPFEDPAKERSVAAPSPKECLTDTFSTHCSDAAMQGAELHAGPSSTGALRGGRWQIRIGQLQAYLRPHPAPIETDQLRSALARNPQPLYRWIYEALGAKNPVQLPHQVR